MEFIYKDGRKFKGLVQVSGESQGWQLRAENPMAELGLKALGVMAAATLGSEEGRERIQKAGWDEATVMTLAGGGSVLFTQMEPFAGLEKLIAAVVGTDRGLRRMVKTFGWNVDSGPGE